MWIQNAVEMNLVTKKITGEGGLVQKTSREGSAYLRSALETGPKGKSALECSSWVRILRLSFISQQVFNEHVLCAWPHGEEDQY